MNKLIQSDIHFCFVIASYNNEKNIANNLNSIIQQTYKNWRVIYVNDCSTDKTSELFHEIKDKDKFIYLENETRFGQSYSKYKAYQLVHDLEVVCILDGDDWLSDENVLSTLKDYYTKDYKIITSNYNIYKKDTITNNRISAKYTIDELKNIRSMDKWLFKHLKTGYGFLFKSIPEHYFKLNNNWLTMATDVAEMTCVTEFSNANVLCVDDIFYTYNYDNSILYPNSYYNSKDDVQRKSIHEHIKRLPKCKYSFPYICIINLLKDYDKKIQMINQMNCIRSPYSFLEAVNGYLQNPIHEKYISEFHTKSYPKNKYCLHKKHIIPGSLGLIQSIFKLLPIFLNTDLEHLLILEDDVFALKDFSYYLFINETVLKDKDLIYLGCHSSTDLIYKNRNDKDIFIDMKTYPKLIYGTYSIIISRKLAAHILTVGLENIINLNLSWDLFLNYIRETTDFRFFLYFKELFVPDVMKDGIQEQRGINFYIKNEMNLNDYNLNNFTPEIKHKKSIEPKKYIKPIKHNFKMKLISR